MEEKTVIFKLSQDLKDRISEKAKKYGLTKSSYIKMLIMKDLENE